MGPEHRTVETNGIRLHVVVDGQGPLVVFLHGFPECWYSWRHQLVALAPRFRVVAPDLRGYGESDRPESIAAYDLTELRADVLGLIHALGERDAVIVGHDWGGAIAWTFAMEHPEATRRLVIMNCPHPAKFQEGLRNPQQLLRSWYMFFFQLPHLPELLLGANGAHRIGEAIRRSAVRGGSITEEDLTVLRQAISRPGALRAAINYYRAAFRSDEALASLPHGLRRFLFGDRPFPSPRRTAADWPKIAAPTLVIWGEDDVALRKETSFGMESLVEGPFTLRYVPHCGHWVQQEAADQVNAWLLEFLGDLAPDPVLLPAS